MYDISIIIINYNSTPYTINCLDSLIKHTSDNLSCQYIVVDNASNAENYQELKVYIQQLKNSLHIELARSNINTGFGGGNMIGVQKAQGKYLAFINNDTIIEDDCLYSLKNFMDRHSDAGVCGPQSFTEKRKLLPAFDHFASIYREIFGRKVLETINSKKYPQRHKHYTKPLQVQFVSGSFMFFKASDFNFIGGFDTNIFLYYEETDISLRLEKINKKTYLVPEKKYIHYHGASTEKSVAIKTELKISLLYVIRKHYGIIPFYVLLTYLRIKYFFSSIVKPKYWSLWFVLLSQAPLTKSLKHKQQIQPIS